MTKDDETVHDRICGSQSTVKENIITQRHIVDDPGEGGQSIVRQRLYVLLRGGLDICWQGDLSCSPFAKVVVLKEERAVTQNPMVSSRLFLHNPLAPTLPSVACRQACNLQALFTIRMGVENAEPSSSLRVTVDRGTCSCLCKVGYKGTTTVNISRHIA